ncbi:MAG: nitrogen fixation protein NifX [Deltaproteobacteria bacterium]|nr:nitrogen fixation protein NifX [Deltaproteobacteria bacterium]
MRVAFTSTTGERIDEHFGAARSFHVWEVGPDEAKFLEEVSPGGGGDEEDRIAARADAIAGCAIVYTLQIGGPAAARLVARRIHPMKTGGALPVAEAVARLQEVLKGSPPPWLRKAMNAVNAQKFAEEE